MKSKIKNFFTSVVKDKKKLIILIVCLVILVFAIVMFVSGRKSTANKLKQEDVVMESLLDIFYEDKDENNMSETLLGMSRKDYFANIEKENHDLIFTQLSTLGEADIIDDLSAEDITNKYTKASIEMITKVKRAKIIDKQEVDNGYRYVIEVVPSDLNDAYKKGNDCAADLLAKIKKEDPSLAEMEGHEVAVYYYCIAKGMEDVDKTNSGEKATIEVTLNKNDKGQYVPDESSLKELLSAAF